MEPKFHSVWCGNFLPFNDQVITALKWAGEFTTISEAQVNIILEAKKSLIFTASSAWMKKGNSEFDVAQGSYDGAETCEIVGLYILSKLVKLQNIEIGLYRDDGLVVSRSSKRQVEVLKKKIQAIFNDMSLEVRIDANLKSVNFLDISMDLETNIYKPFIKTNTTPFHIHNQSNHLPMIIKNLPASFNTQKINNFLQQNSIWKGNPYLSRSTQEKWSWSHFRVWPRGKQREN